MSSDERRKRIRGKRRSVLSSCVFRRPSEAPQPGGGVVPPHPPLRAPSLARRIRLFSTLPYQLQMDGSVMAFKPLDHLVPLAAAAATSGFSFSATPSRFCHSAVGDESQVEVRRGECGRRRLKTYNNSHPVSSDSTHLV